MKKEVICIVCPKGCHIEVEQKEGQEMTFKYNQCNRGPIYVKKELTNPTRMLTTTVKIEGAIVNQLSVVSSSDLPKGRIMDCMKELANVKVKAPIKVKDVVYANILGLGVDILATKTLEKVE
ncbi:DUF1667 domain-containing protein [Mycoplasma sp. P36-A1]|uniref:DUF1667 domain-containing protein n=1 Tax=Mycoplasma sp. P36-A1 TaxID=3252900 RepID=UPI003C2B73C8